MDTKKQIQKGLESTQIDDFLVYLHSPWRIIWTNFLAGIFRGLGVAIGATAVLAGVIWVLSLVEEIPILGKYAAQLTEQISVYAEETNYGDDLAKLQNVLERIEKNLQSK